MVLGQAADGHAQQLAVFVAARQGGRRERRRANPPEDLCAAGEVGEGDLVLIRPQDLEARVHRDPGHPAGEPASALQLLKRAADRCGRLLHGVLGIGLRREVGARDGQHGALVAREQFPKRLAVACLSLCHKGRIVHCHQTLYSNDAPAPRFVAEILLSTHTPSGAIIRRRVGIATARPPSQQMSGKPRQPNADSMHH